MTADMVEGAGGDAEWRTSTGRREVRASFCGAPPAPATAALPHARHARGRLEPALVGFVSYTGYINRTWVYLVLVLLSQL